MNTEALKGHLDLLLLAVLHSHPAHGYAIIEELKRRSAGTFDLPEGTIYPALHRLERASLITSRWSEETGRRRRVYELTQRGLSALEKSRQEWQQFALGINTVLQEEVGLWPA
jgi:PadR family transcriptional regulator, regulatory protein PadR